MTDRMIPVPESLIERIERFMREPSIPIERVSVMAELRALLLQSHPTDDVEHKNGCEMALPHGLIQEGTCTCGAWNDAAPPSIADMVPGTTFTAEFHGERDIFFRCRDSLARAGRYLVSMDAIDPSTIRDITPPRIEDMAPRATENPEGWPYSVAPDGAERCGVAFLGYEKGDGSCEYLPGHPGRHWSTQWGSWSL